ncbi:hypothetical protein Naga_102056g1 [Nannochloropsis gaditana]|uniref:Uncharacterized protein n=1 Tax=Nannochloropsis gaditana TaxID=72520 RepID=W7TTZ0_9STRA|nr:hypothetical protein Naga_102056g1 [Nannochloropsis gaditana]
MLASWRAMGIEIPMAYSISIKGDNTSYLNTPYLRHFIPNASLAQAVTQEEHVVPFHKWARVIAPEYRALFIEKMVENIYEGSSGAEGREITRGGGGIRGGRGRGGGEGGGGGGEGGAESSMIAKVGL